MRTFLFVVFLSFCLVFVQSDFSLAVPKRRGNPATGRELFRHFCAVCHGLNGQGDGVNASNLDPQPRNFTNREYMMTRTDEQLRDIIVGGGPAVAMSVMMPPWGKTLTEESVEDLITYIRTFSDDPSEKDRMERIEVKGSRVSLAELRVARVSKEMITRENCILCHSKERTRFPIAPNLGHEGSKLKKTWLFSFLKNPFDPSLVGPSTRIRPVGFIPLTKTRMPNFFLTDEEAAALVEFLMTKRDESITRAEMGTIDMSEEEIERGKRLFEDRLGCNACHRTDDTGGGIVGPDLRIEGHRLRPEWVFKWLANPVAHRADSPMPNFGLSPERIRTLIAYIWSLSGMDPNVEDPDLLPVSVNKPQEELVKLGEKLFQQKNCLFCHSLESYFTRERIEKGVRALPLHMAQKEEVTTQ